MAPELSRYPWSVPIDKASDVEALFGIEIELPEQPVASKSISSEKDVIIRMNGKFNVMFPNPDTRQAMVDRLKTLSERKYDPDNYRWEVPLRLATELIGLFDGANTDISADVMEYIANHNNLIQLSSAVTSDWTSRCKLVNYTHSKRLVFEFLELSNGRALIADEMGLGKTIQTIGYLQMHPEFTTSGNCSSCIA